MDIEQKQAEHIDYYVKQASAHKGASLSNVIAEATSHPSLFAFSEILAVPNVLEVWLYEYRPCSSTRLDSYQTRLTIFLLVYSFIIG